MKKFFKWFGIIVGTLVVLVVLTLLIAPMFVDLQKFKPTIEKTVEDSTGRSLAIGGDIELSLFPWAGVTLKNISLGNPDGFESGSFAEFSEFEVRMKLLPLISRDVQVKHVVLKGLRLTLEKNSDGKANWEFAGAGEEAKEAPAAPKDAAEEDASEADAALPIKSLAVGEISVTDGSILYIDHQSDVRKELSDLNVRITNISFETPVEMSLSGKLDGKPFSLAGNVGPFGPKPGEGDLDIDMTAKAFDVLELRLNGTVKDPAAAPAYTMHLAVNPFSPRRLIKEVAPDTALPVSDPAVLGKLALEMDVVGDTAKVALSNGKLILDDTTTTFRMTAKDFSKPDVSWDVRMDGIDLDRYLPKSDESEGAAKEGAAGGGSGAGQAGDSGAGEAVDYTPLRSLVLDGNIEVGQLKAGGGTFRDIVIKVTGKGGKFALNPFSMNLYEGALKVAGNVDVTGKKPKTAVTLNLEGVQIEPLLKDFIKKDFITGTTLAKISLSMTGDTPDQIKQTLNGKGDLQFNDGAIRNVSLLDMIQNVQAAFGSGGAAGSQETKFSEFRSGFTITNGVVNTTGTTVSSPVLKVDVTGSADLVQESLDFRINPTYINPKNQKTSGMSISGNQVPVLVTGTFSDPKFKPDLETAAKKVVTEKLTDKLKEAIGESADGETSDSSNTVEDSVKSILKGLPFGK